MFGFTLISKQKLKKLEADLLQAETDAKTTEYWWHDKWLEAREQREKCIELLECVKGTIPLLEEALEQQTKDKKEIEKQFSAYIAAQQLMR